MKKLEAVAFALILVGALNWGLVALAEFDLVATLVGLEFGETNAVSRIVYGLVGLAAVYEIALDDLAATPVLPQSIGDSAAQATVEAASVEESEPIAEPAAAIEPPRVVEPQPVMETPPAVEPPSVVQLAASVAPSATSEEAPRVETAPLAEPEPETEPEIAAAPPVQPTTSAIDTVCSSPSPSSMDSVDESVADGASVGGGADVFATGVASRRVSATTDGAVGLGAGGTVFGCVTGGGTVGVAGLATG